MVDEASISHLMRLSEMPCLAFRDQCFYFLTSCLYLSAGAAEGPSEEVLSQCVLITLTVICASSAEPYTLSAMNAEPPKPTLAP